MAVWGERSDSVWAVGDEGTIMYFDGGIWQTIEKNVPDLFASTLKVNPTGKFGTPAEVASGVVFLASPVASRISGTNLVIDGALTVAV